MPERLESLYLLPFTFYTTVVRVPIRGQTDKHPLQQGHDQMVTVPS